MNLEYRIDNNHIALVKLQKEMCELINASNWFLEKIANRGNELYSNSKYNKKTKEQSTKKFEAKVF